eukprot:EG_transcript_8288
MSTTFPTLKKRGLGSETGFKRCIFSSGSGKQFQENCQNSDVWEFQGAFFGLSTLPKLFMSLMKVLQKLWRSEGLQIFVYLDDTNLFGSTEHLVKKRLLNMLNTLAEAGFKIRQKKSIFTLRKRVGISESTSNKS